MCRAPKPGVETPGYVRSGLQPDQVVDSLGIKSLPDISIATGLRHRSNDDGGWGNFDEVWKVVCPCSVREAWRRAKASDQVQILAGIYRA